MIDESTTGIKDTPTLPLYVRLMHFTHSFAFGALFALLYVAGVMFYEREDLAGFWEAAQQSSPTAFVSMAAVAGVTMPLYIAMQKAPVVILLFSRYPLKRKSMLATFIGSVFASIWLVWVYLSFWLMTFVFFR